MVCAMEENFDEHGSSTEACGPALVKQHDSDHQPMRAVVAEEFEKAAVLVGPEPPPDDLLDPVPVENIR